MDPVRTTARELAPPEPGSHLSLCHDEILGNHLQ